MTNIVQCKDIPDEPILQFLLKAKGNLCSWYFVRNAMPENKAIFFAPKKLILAKMSQLIKKGLINGCTCGCGGDFEITPKAEEYQSINI
jgi:hypothetical protein